jgi:IS5 family transposase
MVGEDHVLRRVKEKLPVEEIAEKREEWKKCLGREGYGMEVGIRALFVQYWGDYSDREMEDRLRYDILYKWFCGFTLEGRTPDHTYFCRVRRNLGEKGVEAMFSRITDEALRKQIIKRLGSFVDASAIRRKEAEWRKRDEEIEKEQRERKGSSNSAKEIAKFSGDKEARWGCKGKKKYWFGYKRHVSVDVDSGLIERLWVTAANVNDAEVFNRVCPRGKEVLADRGYDNENVRRIMAERRCQDGVMRLKHRRDFDKERNKELSKRRAPWEHVFSKMSRRTRYMGLRRTYLQALMEGIVHNVKRLIALEGEYLPVMGTA